MKKRPQEFVNLSNVDLCWHNVFCITQIISHLLWLELTHCSQSTELILVENTFSCMQNQTRRDHQKISFRFYNVSCRFCGMKTKKKVLKLSDSVSARESRNLVLQNIDLANVAPSCEKMIIREKKKKTLKNSEEGKHFVSN